MYKLNFIIIIIILLYIQLSNSQSYTTFLIHGIASKANELIELETYLINIGLNAISLELRNDPKTSYKLDLDKQCKLYYEKILNIVNTKKINLIGISQGGLIARCIVEKYNNNNILISNLITIASPNMGIYYSNINNYLDFNLIFNRNFNLNFSIESVNKENTFAITIQEYWKDPFNYDKYLTQHKFITLLNNEEYHINYNKYKNNIKALDTFTTIWSNLDTVIIPKESSKFSFYNITTVINLKKLELYNLKNTNWYINDNLGLKYLELNNKYETVMIPCIHNEFKLYKCFINVKNNNNETLFDIIKSKLMN